MFGFVDGVHVWTGAQDTEYQSALLTYALQTAARGAKIIYAQLLKGGIEQGPTRPTRMVERLEWLRPNCSRVIDSTPSADEKDAVATLWQHLEENLCRVNLLIIEGAGTALQLGLIEDEQLRKLLAIRPLQVGLTLIGPHMPLWLEEFASLWTETRQHLKVAQLTVAKAG